MKGDDGGKPYQKDHIRTRDGGDLSVGLTTPDWNTSGRKAWMDVVISRFDHNGNLTWKREITRKHYVDILSVMQTRDGGFAVLGSELVDDPTSYHPIPGPSLK